MKAKNQLQSQMDGGFIGEEWYCPNCGESWGLEEFETQSCYCCGYPNDTDNEYDDDEWDDYSDQQEEQPIKECCTCEMPNIRGFGEALYCFKCNKPLSQEETK